jgi:hypothetical protein
VRSRLYRALLTSLWRAAIWAVVGGGLIAAVVALRTSPEFQLSVRQILTWFALFSALCFLPALAMELGAKYLHAELGPEDPRPRN